MNRVEIKNEDNGKINCKVNGTTIPKLTYIKFEAEPGIVPEFMIGTAGLPGLEIENAIIHIDPSPVNVRDAVLLLREQIQKDEELRKAFVESAKSKLDELDVDKVCLNVMGHEIAEEIINRLFGVE